MTTRFASGREILVGRGIPQAVPITLNAATYVGAVVYGIDGNFYWSDGARWLRATEEYTTAAPNATIPVMIVRPDNALPETNFDVALAPRGTGALLADIPDDAVTGGNKRGPNAVDFQMIRSFASQVASGTQSVIGGGIANTALGTNSTVGGGYENSALNSNATVGGGRENSASNESSTVAGGIDNVASGYRATIGGGYNNTASGTDTTIGGGDSNASAGANTTIGGGRNNITSDFSSTISGGTDNNASGPVSTIGGGALNTVSGERSTIGGGYDNNVTGSEAAIGGGILNDVSGNRAIIGGGTLNSVSGDRSTIGGGYNNAATTSDVTIGGGDSNVASGSTATIGGGRNNTTSGFSSTVSGGGSNTASGDFSVISGGANATTRGLYGRQSFASGQFGAAGDAQYGLHVLRRQTTDATLSGLSADGNALSATNIPILPNNSLTSFRVQVVCIQTGGSAGTAGDSKAWEITGAIKRGANAAATALLGTPTITVLGADTNLGATNATGAIIGAAASTTLGGLLINLTGEVNKNLRAVATVTLTEVSY